MIGKKIQNYKILSLLGQGGMGTVYKALDVKLERYAALKILNINSSVHTGMLARFRKEARNQAKLSHPNIVSVYGFVEEKDVVGIAMEFVEGQTIEQILFEEGKLLFQHALRIMSQVLDGISHAHSHGFIHRDLKPSNIIIDLNGNAKIMDFGISISIDEMESITQHSARPGTLMYMSPEQLSGNEVTIKSDLYSLGITLYEMITGVHPFNAKTYYEIVDSHINKLPPKISDEYPSIPIELDEIILKAMGKSDVYNFSSAAEFREAIEQILLEKHSSENSDLKTTFAPKEKSIKVKNRSIFKNRIFNFFLFVVFIVLAFVVYSVVEKTIKLKSDEAKKNSLNYSQDYSQNPGYLEKTDWQLNILNIEKNLNAVYFLDNLNGIIASSGGTIFKTTDGGKNWIQTQSGTGSDLYEIYSNNSKLFCCGDYGTLLRFDFTNKSWERITPDTNESLFSIKFINENIGFISGSKGLILKTEDGGITWNKIKLNSNENLFRIDFADNQTGFAVGWDGTVLKTVNQGSDWKKINIGYKSYLKDILFVNQFLGFIVGGEGLVLRTEDGGSHWRKIDLGTNSGLYKIFFENNNIGFILSNRGEIFKSTDAGKVWKATSIGKPVVLNDIKKLQAGNYIIVGNNGSVFISKNEVNF
jgi:serine/threonine protein kinase